METCNYQLLWIANQCVIQRSSFFSPFCEGTKGQKQIFFYHFSILEASKLILALIFGRFCLIKNVLFFNMCQSTLKPNNIWRENGTKQIQILVLVLSELGFWCFQKAQKYFKTRNCIGLKKKKKMVNFFHYSYKLYSLLVGYQLKKTMQPAFDSMKILFLREVNRQVEKNSGSTKTIKVAKNLRFRYCWSILFCRSGQPTESNV